MTRSPQKQQKQAKQQRYFIALLPPKEVQQVALQIQQHFAQVYHSRAALNSPPHITLQPPFEWEITQLPSLEKNLAQFAQQQPSIPLILDGFSAFKPRVIYINVLKTPELLAIEKDLRHYLESSLNIVHQVPKTRPFAPHLTVAYRDLTKDNFRKAWLEFKQRPLHFELAIAQLTLLVHNGKFWEISNHFSLNH